jgi:hypothetical protein
LTEIYHLLGMKSSRDDLIDRMKTGWGCFVLASETPKSENIGQRLAHHCFVAPVCQFVKPTSGTGQTSSEIKNKYYKLRSTRASVPTLIFKCRYRS